VCQRRWASRCRICDHWLSLPQNSGRSVNLLDALGKVDDAWAKVERAGMTYGVMPKVGLEDMSDRPSGLEPKPTAR
jgi:hypothetical protein